MYVACCAPAACLPRDSQATRHAAGMAKHEQEHVACAEKIFACMTPKHAWAWHNNKVRHVRRHCHSPAGSPAGKCSSELLMQAMCTVSCSHSLPDVVTPSTDTLRSYAKVDDIPACGIVHVVGMGMAYMQSAATSKVLVCKAAKGFSTIALAALPSLACPQVFS